MKPFHQWLGDLADELSDGKVNDIGLTSEDLPSNTNSLCVPKIGSHRDVQTVMRCSPCTRCAHCRSTNILTTDITIKTNCEVYSYTCVDCNVMFRHLKMRDETTGE